MKRLPRPLRIAINVALSSAVLGYLIWQIDLSRTIDEIASANGWLLLAALAVFAASTVGMAWRWQLLLIARGIVEPLRWLVNLYFIGYAARIYFAYSDALARKTFRYSIVYLAALFAALLLDHYL